MPADSDPNTADIDSTATDAGTQRSMFVVWFMLSRKLRLDLFSTTYTTIITNNDIKCVVDKIEMQTSSANPLNVELRFFFRKDTGTRPERSALFRLQFHGFTLTELGKVTIQPKPNPLIIRCALDNKAIFSELVGILRPHQQFFIDANNYFEKEHSLTKRMCEDQYDYKPFLTRWDMWRKVQMTRMRCNCDELERPAEVAFLATRLTIE